MTRIISAVNDEGLRRSIELEHVKGFSGARSKDLDYENYIFMPQHNLYVAKKRSHFEKNWYDAHRGLHKENARMLTPREFADFLLLLRNGNDEFQKIYKDITEVREPRRVEWFDADLKVVNDVLYINYNHRIVNGNLQPQNSEPLETCLMKDCNVDLTSFNRQGLPIREGVDFKYWSPKPVNNSVAWFFVNSDWAVLDYGRDPRYSNYELGVRAAKIKE
ncbi:hypothetical protein HYX19_03200 [Candidatus Woesearchaeota archaeon]|nr:hypothetical protein [Candidatus Woesearchaeota archaeon]